MLPLEDNRMISTVGNLVNFNDRRYYRQFISFFIDICWNRKIDIHKGISEIFLFLNYHY